jgi:hypothetical protein
LVARVTWMNYREGESVREQGGHWIQGGARLQVKETRFFNDREGLDYL